MANKLPLSVYIITKNEAEHIAEVLDAVSFANDIVVVDSGSTDLTTEIAQAKGARVVFNEWAGFAKQKSFAMQQCKHDWVLNLDGDEVLSKEGAEAIVSIVENPQADCFRLRFEDMFWGTAMSKNSAKRSIVRLFRRNQISYPFDRKVHENVILPKGACVDYVPGLVTHFGYESTECLMEKQNCYSSLKAAEKFEKGKSPSLIKLITIFPLTFFKSFFLKRMFLSGVRGLVHAHIEAMYAFLKEAKLFEYTYRAKQDK